MASALERKLGDQAGEGSYASQLRSRYPDVAGIPGCSSRGILNDASRERPDAAVGVDRGGRRSGAGAGRRARGCAWPARCARLSVGDVAQTLKLGPRQVEALEDGDWQGLPGQTFVRGFVRNYARLLQLDPDAAAGAARCPAREAGGQSRTCREHAARRRCRAASRRRDRTVIVRRSRCCWSLAGLAYVLLPDDLLGAARKRADTDRFGVAQGGGARDSLRSVPAAPVASSRTGRSAGPTQQQRLNPQALAPADTAPAPACRRARRQRCASRRRAMRNCASVFSGESWVEVRDRDGRSSFRRRSTAGTEQAVGGQAAVQLVIGNAADVTLMLATASRSTSRRIPRGEVARLTLE